MVVFKDFFLNVHPYTWENDPVFFFVDIFFSWVAITS